MPLTLVLGPANSAKAGVVLGAYAAAAQRDALLVVPTSADAAYYDRELAADGVTLGRALTFPRLLEEIARRAGYARPRLTPLQRERLLRRVVSALDLPSFADSKHSPGFAAAAGRMIAQLGLVRAGAPRFSSALQQWAAAGEMPLARSAYAADLAAIYLRYRSELERLERVDQETYAWEALDRLRVSPRSWEATPVFLYGFDDLTAIELDAVETLSGPAGAEVTVSLTYEPGRAALQARATVVEELRGMAERVENLPPLADWYEPHSRGALHHLERHIFEAGAPRLDPGETVTLMEAGGERAEAELVAAEVASALAEGVAPEDIVVVARAPHRTGALLERVLARYGVRAHSARRVPITHTALGRGLSAMAGLAFAPQAATARDLFAYLRTPGVVADRHELDLMEARVLRAGLSSAVDARANLPASPHLIRALGRVDALGQAPDPAAALAEQAVALLAAAHRGTAPVLDASEALDAAAAARLLAGLRELGELDQSSPPNSSELLEALSQLELSVHQADAQRGAVLVAEPLAIRARRFRRVFVTGLCEGEFPSPAGVAPDPFLDEDRRRELALASGLVLPPDPDPLDRERYLLYACVSRATERVTFSYRSADEDGNQVMASPFLDDLAELFPPEWRTRRRQRLLADVVWAPEEAPTPREAALSAVVAATGLATTGAAPGADDTRVLSATALAHVRHREVVSPAALEQFAACPVAWLVERQLRPDPLEPEPDAIAKGNLMHELLREILASLQTALSEATLADAERRLSELLAQIATEREFAPGRPDSVRRALLRGVEADLRRYLRHEAASGGGWEPRHLEFRFGLEDENGEIEREVHIGSGEERIRLGGIIDRVDVRPDPTGRGRAVIRDYKSGRNKPEWASAKWLDERQIQVALYMIVVRRLLGLEPVAGVYQPLGGPELRPRGAHTPAAPAGVATVRTDGMEVEELETLLQDIERDAVELAGRLRRGELTPCPATCSRDGCRHPGICWAT